MALVRCNRCVGSGTVMGGGMMMDDCNACEGTGKISDIVVAAKAISLDFDKRSKSYKEAVVKIMDLHSCDRVEAVRIFDDEFSKLPA
jgi:hypothetical protein